MIGNVIPANRTRIYPFHVYWGGIKSLTKYKVSLNKKKRMATNSLGSFYLKTLHMFYLFLEEKSYSEQYKYTLNFE